MTEIQVCPKLRAAALHTLHGSGRQGSKHLPTDSHRLALLQPLINVKGYKKVNRKLGRRLKSLDRS